MGFDKHETDSSLLSHFLVSVSGPARFSKGPHVRQDYIQMRSVVFTDQAPLLVAIHFLVFLCPPIDNPLHCPLEGDR